MKQPKIELAERCEIYRSMLDLLIAGKAGTFCLALQLSTQRQLGIKSLKELYKHKPKVNFKGFYWFNPKDIQVIIQILQVVLGSMDSTTY